MIKATKQNNYHYNASLKDFASQNRNNMTKSEACIWKYVLKNRQMKGYQFRRQRPILNYIVDFVCFSLMFVIEVDGTTHDDDNRIQKDLKRTKELESIGFTVLRFSAWEVLNKIDDVDIMIGSWIEESVTLPPPIPASEGNKKRKGILSNKIK